MQTDVLNEIDTYMIVPTYNEVDNIDELIGQLLALPVRIGVIVVDDKKDKKSG
jgi:glycosyltransferase involved in cell wall biosynthesis